MWSGRKPRRPLQSECLLNAARGRCTQPSCGAGGEKDGALRVAGESGTWLEPRRPWGPVVKATFPIDPQPTPDPVIDDPAQSEVTNTQNTDKTTKSAPNVTEAPKRATVTKSKLTAKRVKSSQPKTNDLLNPPQTNQSPIEENSHLLDILPLGAFVELNLTIFTAVPTLPSGSARSLIVLFVTEYGQVKTLLLSCWNAEGVCGRNLELDHFLGQHVVDLCLLTETHLRSDEAFRMVRYVCHRTYQLKEGGGKAVLFRQSVDLYAVLVKGLKHLEAAAM